MGRGRPLVLFHGWGFNREIWYPLASTLQHHYELFLVDLPGFGESDLMSWSVFKTLILQKLPTHFSLLGWSMGALYALRLAIEEPLSVSNLISIAASPYFLKQGDWPGIEPAIFQGFFLKLKKNPKQVLEDFLTLQAHKNSYRLLQMPTVEALSQGLEVLGLWDFRTTLNSLSMPVSFLFGRLDKITPMATMMVMQAQYPKFHYDYFKKAAHMPFLSHQKEFIDFLNRRLSS